MKKATIYFLCGSLVVAGLIFLLIYFRKDNRRVENLTSGQEKRQSEFLESNNEQEIKFTHRIFDPSKISHITPLGELNGGYEETQTINGVMINIKTDSRGNAEPVEVYAPADITLEDYSYFAFGTEPANWHLGFRISPDVKLSFDHITWVPAELAEAAPATPSSAYVPPRKKISFRAGELIAKTTGTSKAHNWNIYMRDGRQKNIFVNQGRYERARETYDYVNAVCPFEYYDDAVRQSYLALMGFSSPGQSKACGSNSKDVKGTISGLWHLEKEGLAADYQGQYATPFSIYKTSSGEIVIYEIDRQRFILGPKNPTYKDPAAVTDSHCYSLTQYADSKPDGYVYFKVVSAEEVEMSYNKGEACPAAFPENSITYYR